MAPVAQLQGEGSAVLLHLILYTRGQDNFEGDCLLLRELTDGPGSLQGQKGVTSVQEMWKLDGLVL